QWWLRFCARGCTTCGVLSSTARTRPASQGQHGGSPNGCYSHQLSTSLLCASDGRSHAGQPIGQVQHNPTQPSSQLSPTTALMTRTDQPPLQQSVSPARRTSLSSASDSSPRTQAAGFSLPAFGPHSRTSASSMQCWNSS